MDSDKLQKLANLATVRQHAAAVTSSTNFPRKYINNVSNALGALDNEFIGLLVELVKNSNAEDTATISKRLAEEKAKLKSKTEYKEDLPPITESEIRQSETRPTIKTARVKKDK